MILCDQLYQCGSDVATNSPLQIDHPLTPRRWRDGSTCSWRKCSFPCTPTAPRRTSDNPLESIRRGLCRSRQPKMPNDHLKATLFAKNRWTVYLTWPIPLQMRWLSMQCQLFYQCLVNHWHSGRGGVWVHRVYHPNIHCLWVGFKETVHLQKICIFNLVLNRILAWRYQYQTFLDWHF